MSMHIQRKMKHEAKHQNKNFITWTLNKIIEAISSINAQYEMELTTTSPLLTPMIEIGYIPFYRQIRN